MDIIDERCCGLDVHKKRMVACLIVSDGHGTSPKTIRTFGSRSEDMRA
jgi:transposase